MFYLKACPKCHGDLFSDTDGYGPYIGCAQCGHYLSTAEEARFTQPPLKPGWHSAMPTGGVAKLAA